MRMVKNIFIVISALGILCFIPDVFAGVTTGPNPIDPASNTGLANVAGNLIGVIGTLTEAIAAAAYVAGIGFAVGAIMKFKQHKDNPTQIPVGTPIAMLFIAASLILLPSLINVTKESLFGTNGIIGGPKGMGIHEIEVSTGIPAS